MKTLVIAFALSSGLGITDPPSPGPTTEPTTMRVGDQVVTRSATTPLFDGRTLEGWRGDEKFWSVEQGELVGRSTVENPCTTTTYLHHSKPFTDFELEFEIKLEGAGANSGMQYRSTPTGPEVTDGYDLSGYQADFDEAHRYSGILYETRGRGIAVQRGESVRFEADGTRKDLEPRQDDRELQKHLKSVEADPKKDGWHAYRIVAVGPRLEHWIDGKRMMLTVDRHPKSAARGTFALQVHQGPPMTVRVRNLRIAELRPITD